MSLAAARDLLQSNRPLTALDVLVDCWRSNPSALVGRLAERCGELIDRSLPPIRGRTRKVQHEMWLDVERLGRAADIGRLLGALREPPSARIRERLARLAQRPADPRIARAALDLVLDMPLSSRPARPMYTRALRLLLDYGDARARTPLERRLDELLASMRSKPWALEIDTYMVDQIERTLARLPAPPLEPSAEDRAHGAAIDDRLDTLMSAPAPSEHELFARRVAERVAAAAASVDREDDLIAAIYADPAAEAPRRVYADWLAERGDPRGELMALQLSRGARARLVGKQARRERQLLRAHAAVWLGEIEPAVDSSTCRFDRGFVSGAIVRFRTPKEREDLLGSRGFRTLEMLVTADMAAIDAPNMVNVRRLGMSHVPDVPRERGGGGPRAFERLAEGYVPLSIAAAVAAGDRERLYEALSVVAPWPYDGALARQLAAGDALAALRELHCAFDFEPSTTVAGRDDVDRALGWLLGGELARRLVVLSAHLRLPGCTPDVGAWLARISAAMPRLEQLELLTDPFMVTLWRPPAATAAAGADAALDTDEAPRAGAAGPSADQPTWRLLLSCRSDTVFERRYSEDEAAVQLLVERHRQRRVYRALFGGLQGRLASVTVQSPNGRLRARELSFLSEALGFLGTISLPPARRIRG